MQKDRQSCHPLFVNTVTAFGVVECASGLGVIFPSWIACLATPLSMLVVQQAMFAVSLAFLKTFFIEDNERKSEGKLGLKRMDPRNCLLKDMS